MGPYFPESMGVLFLVRDKGEPPATAYSKTTFPPSSMNFWASSFCLLAKLSVLSVGSYSNKIARSLKLGL